MAGVTLRLPVVFSQIVRSSQLIAATKNAHNLIAPSTAFVVPKRYSSFRSSKPVADLSEYPEVEVIINPPEWKFVERVLPSTVVPKPEKKAEYPSGWTPPKALTNTQKYFVARTKNFMVPVYLHVKFRGLRRVTILRYVQGDIWSLERELHKVIVESKGGRPVASRVNELSGQIHFHGDHVNLVKNWLIEKGF